MNEAENIEVEAANVGAVAQADGTSDDSPESAAEAASAASEASEDSGDDSA